MKNNSKIMVIAAVVGVFGAGCFSHLSASPSSASKNFIGTWQYWKKFPSVNGKGRLGTTRLTISPKGHWHQSIKRPDGQSEVRSGSYIVKGKNLITTHKVGTGLRWAKESGLKPGQDYTLFIITYYSLSGSNKLRMGKHFRKDVDEKSGKAIIRSLSGAPKIYNRLTSTPPTPHLR
jgi:hypothetical protein